MVAYGTQSITRVKIIIGLNISSLEYGICRDLTHAPREMQCFIHVSLSIRLFLFEGQEEEIPGKSCIFFMYKSGFVQVMENLESHGIYYFNFQVWKVVEFK